MSKGIGTRLLAATLASIRNPHLKIVYVDTGEDNSVALHIYRKAGFQDLRKQITLKMILNKE